MTDYATHGHGGVEYPLTAATTNSLLRDVDPALYHALNYLSAVLRIHLGPRFVAQSALHGLTFVNADAVRHTLALEPSPHLYSADFKFPLFALYRKSTTYLEHTASYTRSVSELEFAYLLPPLTPVQQSAIAPILRGVEVVLNRAVTQGWHPSYSNGLKVWETANIDRARLATVTYGGFEALQDNENFYRAITGSLVIEERDVTPVAAFESFTGANINVDVEDDDYTVIADLVQAKTWPAPTLTTATPNTGTKVGGTTVTLTGTNLRAGTPIEVWIGGVRCPSATVTSATTATCVTPAHNAYSTFIADVVLIADDEQEASLTAGFTFTTPP